MTTRRCLGYHCALSESCRLWVLPVHGTFPFQPTSVGQDCPHYDPIRNQQDVPWGVGAEAND